MKIDDFDLFQKLIEECGQIRKLGFCELAFSGKTANANCIVGCNPNGTVITVRHYLDIAGLTHFSRRPTNGPAYEVFRPDGSLYVREYIYLGKRYRNCYDGPAYEIFNRNGEATTKKFYYKNDKERLRHIASGAAE
jgi:hypothetical protein